MKVAYLDIETTSKKADDGIIITIGVLVGDEPELVFAANLEEERNALQWLKEKLKDCELIITWYGSGFDIPFIITRALAQKIEFNELFEIPMLDLCEWSKAHLLVSSHSLQSVARFLGVWKAGNFAGPDVHTLYKLFIHGNQEAKRLIIQHCREDIVLLKRVHEKLKPLVEQSGGLTRKNL